MHASEGITLANNFVEGTGGAAFRFNSITNILIRDIILVGNRGTAINTGAMSGLYFNSCTNVIVESAAMASFSTMAINFVGGNDIIVRNSALINSYIGVGLSGTTRAIVNFNLISGADYPLQIDNSSDIVIRVNELMNFTNTGINANNDLRLNIDQNKIYNATAPSSVTAFPLAMYLNQASELRVTANNIFNVSGGIFATLLDSKSVVISRNVIGTSLMYAANIIGFGSLRVINQLQFESNLINTPDSTIYYQVINFITDNLSIGELSVAGTRVYGPVAAANYALVVVGTTPFGTLDITGFSYSYPHLGLQLSDYTTVTVVRDGNMYQDRLYILGTAGSGSFVVRKNQLLSGLYLWGGVDDNMTLNIGTTPGGSEIQAGYNVTSAVKFISTTVVATTDTTVYISGLASGDTLTVRSERRSRY